MELDAGGSRGSSHGARTPSGDGGEASPADVCARALPDTSRRDADPSRRRPADPHPVPAAGRRRRPLPRQAHRRRPGRGHRATSSATATRSCAPSSVYRRAGAPQVARGRAARRSTRTTTACAGAARSSSTSRAAGSSRSRRGPTSSPPGATSCARKLEAGQHELAGELSEGVVLLEDAADARQGRRPQADRARAARARATTEILEAAKHDAALGHRALRRGRAQRRAPRRHAGSSRRSRSRSTACARASAPGTRSSRAPGAGSRASRRRCRALAELGFDVALPDADPPDRPHEPQGPQQHARRRPGRPRLALRGRRRRGRPRRRAPRASARSRTSARCAPRRREHDMDVCLDFAINASADHPWLTEHPDWFHRRPDGTLKYAENPPKKYQDIYNVNWECEDWRGLWEEWRRIFLFWVELRREGLPRRQPAHEADPVLGVADRRGPQGRPRRDLPRRGVHPPGDDAPAREDRLHPGLHVLHLEEHAARADRVRRTSSRGGRRRSTSGRTSSPTRRTSSRPTSCTAARPRSTRASCSPRR